jgi:hypothetical protein
MILAALIAAMNSAFGSFQYSAQIGGISHIPCQHIRIEQSAVKEHPFKSGAICHIP